MWIRSYGLLVICWCLTTSSAILIDSKVGQCPTSGLRDISHCPGDQSDECDLDEDCSGSSRCCSDGCRKVCIMPVLSSCEKQRVEIVKRARALDLPDNEIAVPECNKVGDFKPVQCNPLEGHCFCVDKSGLERPGTRARSLEFINCTNPRPCAGFVCRMLCPYEFELDAEGCPLCQCRDPCRGIKCPGSQMCQLEEVPCDEEPCPPLPTCKKARSLDSYCPMGIPLMMPGGGDAVVEKPFLCGTDPGKPTCPDLYDCLVQPGADYGLCCPAANRLQKPGTCPAEDHANATMCGVPCDMDLQCQGADKCCHSSACGKHCIPPQNFTVCLQQKMITEMLSVRQEEGMGYVPQCTEEGQFQPRQCSRNGLVCWCVDSQGRKIKGSMGSADGVICNEGEWNAVGRSLCDSTLCSSTCEFGYRVDARGCATCECDQPCDHYPCPEGQECAMVHEEACKGRHCPTKPTCKPKFVEPCAFGKYLTNMVTGKAISCSVGSRFSCPSGYHCVNSLANQANFCCPDKPKTALTKEGVCPVLNESHCNDTLLCGTDHDCPGILKCCQAGECGPVCAEPEHPELLPPRNFDRMEPENRLPTICELLRDISAGKRGIPTGLAAALAPPKCTETGEYEKIQCHGNQCWCVDEFGIEIPHSRGPADSVTTCQRSRSELDCPGMTCRLGCDFGFVRDNSTNCLLCECRNPCSSITCGAGQVCQMVSTPCQEEPFCPPLPFCVAVKRTDSVCPEGEPYLSLSTDTYLECNPRSRALSCPDGYSCTSDEDSTTGVCCPNMKEIAKVGQCPYLTPMGASCDFECASDAECEGTTKCCSNGCGTQCVDPVLKTSCQHQLNILKYAAREQGIPANRVFLPRCLEDGRYALVQCDPLTRACWCVNNAGLEVAGTRVPPGLEPTCQQPRECPAFNCSLSCVHGFHIDASGCPECRCHNPCQAMNCRSFEECQLVSLHCVQEPCPPVAMCVPKPTNPCGPNGQPLKRANGQLTACGAMEEACPSSHKCHLSPLGQFAVCCPKPREVCFQERDIGSCKSSVLRWSFNDKRNKCEPFRYTGCGGNMNSFASEQDCKTVCPVLSTCEKMREKNSKAAEKYKKVVFMPKCSISGDWDLIQCLEEVGICWCVDKDGEPIKGSLIRGTPTCGVRQARHRSFDPDICEEGQTVHVCPKDLCSKRVCLGHPKAVCRVNPCNGCHAVFYDGNGRPVDCNSSLTSCQRETQVILNSMRVLEIPASSTFGFASPFWTPEVDAEEFRPSRNGLERALVFHDGNQGIPKLPVTSILTVAQRNKRTTNGDEDDVVTSPIDDGLLGEFDEFTLGDFAIEIDSWENEEKEKTAERKPVSWEPTTAVPKLLPALRDAIKPGFCPFVRPNSILRFLTQFGDQVKCEDKCISDADCHGNLRCCPSTCGTLCTAPMLAPWNANPAPATPLSMTLTPPQCTSSGDYAKEQQQGVLSWCVNADGEPIDDSLTRGSVKCSPSGTILEQRPLGTVCADPAIVPKVCRHQCLEARCYAHPEAICVADPCEECSVRFVTANGEPVDCQSKCTQPQSSGYCRAAFQRYFYNITAQQCQEFIFSGCAGNENNFYSLEECQVECEKSVDVCELPKEEGLCRASFARWYYNSDTLQCEEFYFGGCGGNPNNFHTKQQCESRCPDFVLCPRMSENGDVRGCQRSAVCNDSLTCPGHEEFVCVVDPCTCQARFTDFEGSPIQCQQAVPVTTTASTTTAATTTTTTTTTPASTTITMKPMTTTTMKSTTSHVPEVFVEARQGHVSTKPSIELVSTTKASTTASKIGVIIKDQGLVGTIEHKPVKKWEGKRGKSLQVDKVTRCQKMRNNQETNKESFLVECDILGKFKPLQCANKQSAQDPVHCWCVDEAGNQLPNSTLFLKDTQTCQYVPVTAVAVSLGFAHGHEMQMDQSSMEEALQSQVGELLQLLEANTMENTVVVQDRPQDPRIKFTLIGENTVDVASQIEDMVKSGYLVFELAGHSMAADLTSSQFHHRVGQPRVESLNPESLTIMENREIVAEALNIEAPYLAIIILFAVLAVMTICGVIIGVVLYRRKTTGTYPKGTKVTLGYPHSPRGPAKQKQAQLHNNGMNVHAHRGFPRVGISPAEQEYSSNQQQYPHLSPTIPRSNRLGLKENKEAW